MFCNLHLYGDCGGPSSISQRALPLLYIENSGIQDTLCDKLLLSIRTISCDCKNGWRTCFYYITGGILHNAKAIPATRRAGGLFVLQSSVFRISEKLLHGEQGHALTKKQEIFFDSLSWCAVLCSGGYTVFCWLQFYKLEFH